MGADVRFKAFFAESLIMQSKNTISGLTCHGTFLCTVSQDLCITSYFPIAIFNLNVTVLGVRRS